MKRFLLLALTLCLFGVSAFAQSNTGNLIGTISDPSGVIPGATVVVTSNVTGAEKTVVSSDSGTFSVPQLDVGTYNVKITAAGHKTFTVTDVKIDVGKDYNLNATLEVGNIAENVTVVGGADVINSTDASLNTTVTERQIVELPLNGRNPLSLVLLQAGTSSNSAQNTTINGQRSSFTNITRDGINVQDNFIRANAVDFLPDRPNVDDTGEFTIVTQNAGAEAGYGASQIQLVTPRGSNEFHGAVYEYNRNSKFASNDYFNNFSKVRRPFLNRNQFGGKGSGPVWKNKLFFFAGYEGFRLRQSTTVNRTILLPNARTGIFTFRDVSGVTRTVNLLTGAFSTTTGVNAIDPVIASRVLANLPTAGNNATIGDQLNTTGLTFSRSTPTDRDAFTMRIDGDVNSKNTINGVFSYKKELIARNDTDVQQGGVACCFTTDPFGFQDAHTKFLALAWRWSPTATLTNEVRGGGQWSDPTFSKTVDTPGFYINLPLINNPEVGFDPQGRETNIYNFQDNAVWIRGSHSIRFGGLFQAFRAAPFGPGVGGQSFIPTYVLGGGTTPTFTAGNTGTFNTAAGCVAATGVNCASNTQVATANSLLALLGGLIGSANQTFNAQSQTGTLEAAPPQRHLAYENYSLYVSDQWRATPRLTLNYGLRYELYTPIREPNGLALEPVFGGGDFRSAILNPIGTYNFVGTNSGGTNFFKTDKNNFAPVLSFAWSPEFKNKFMNSVFPGEGRTVIRGGYRMSYVNDEFIRAADNALIGNAGLTSQLTASGLNARFATAPTFTAPALVVPRTFAQNNALASGFGTVFAIDPNLSIPRTDEFNIGIQREIGWQTAFEARFVHGRSNNLVRGLDLNQINIFAPGFFEDFTRARANLLAGFANPNCAAGSTSGGVACQPLTTLNQAQYFPGSVFTNATILNQLRNGQPGDFATSVIGGFVFIIPAYGQLLLPNSGTGVVDVLTNSAKYRYNALQTEVRRRFSGGMTFQANYTFQKTLTDAPGTGQTRFEPLISNTLGSDYEYGIADYDTTHVFNFNAIYELPFGKGKRWGSDAGAWMDRLIGGWQVTSIIRWDSGAPFSITDPRGTLNRTGRSGRQTASTSLSKDQIRSLVGQFKTPCGVFFIDPSVINLDLNQCNNGVIAPRLAGTTAGVAALGFGQPTFPGQVFFNVAPGQTGNIERNFVSGPTYFNWDASIIKNIKITERVRFQVRAEAFNVLNRANLAITNQFTQANINSTNFGRLFANFQPRIIQFVGRLEF
jgi:hypothetical protein